MITIIIPLDIKHMDSLIKECNKTFIISPFAFKNNKKAISNTIEIFQKANDDIYIFDVTGLTCEVARILNHTCIIKQYISKSLYKTFKDGNFPHSFYSEVLETFETNFKEGDLVSFKMHEDGGYFVGIVKEIENNVISIEADNQIFMIISDFVKKYNFKDYCKTKIISQ